MKPTGNHGVVGGSLGGLFTGIMLRSIGWDVVFTNGLTTISAVEVVALCPT